MTAETVHYSRVPSPVGTLLLAASARGLRILHFDRGRLPRASAGEVWIESPAALQPCVEQLEAYFQGVLRRFTVPLDLKGTEFQKKCWDALCRIPYGKTCSYSDLAREVGRPQAFRAVGQANHNNPVAIIVPCHRVIGATGSLTGYGGGMKIKEFLLRLEGAAGQGELKFGDETRLTAKSRHPA
jgi:methylated-DNA-[protein]-cysteine S-methyltransferase